MNLRVISHDTDNSEAMKLLYLMSDAGISISMVMSGASLLHDYDETDLLFGSIQHCENTTPSLLAYSSSVRARWF